MTEKIGNLPRPGTETKPTGSQSSSGAKRAEQNPRSEQTTSGSDAVSLTDTVTRLQTIEARIRELPEVDRERVEELRRRIDAGEFEIDARLIAQRLLQLEQALA